MKTLNKINFKKLQEGKIAVNYNKDTDKLEDLQRLFKEACPKDESEIFNKGGV